ncbi:MAG: hypothetical protein ACR2JC_08275 [Chloroflexota bacterium]
MTLLDRLVENSVDFVVVGGLAAERVEIREHELCLCGKLNFNQDGVRTRYGGETVVLVNTERTLTGDDALGEIEDRTLAALNRLVASDLEPFKALYSHEPDVTVFGGFGAYECGWDQVSQNIEFAASRFRGGRLEIETLAFGTSGDLAYTV